MHMRSTDGLHVCMRFPRAVWGSSPLVAGAPSRFCRLGEIILSGSALVRKSKENVESAHPFTVDELPSCIRVMNDAAMMNESLDRDK